MNLTWEENTVKIPTEQRKRGKILRGFSEWNFDLLNISRGGFLEEALVHYGGICLDTSVCNQTFLGLMEMSKNSDATLILSSESKHLGRNHIVMLFRLIEDHISSLDIEHKNAASTQYRHIFSKFSLPLKNNCIVSEINFNVRLQTKVDQSADLLRDTF